jgi:hypothetical protein
MKHRRIALAGLAMFGCLTGILAYYRPTGPGMTVLYDSAIRDTRVYIVSERLPDGSVSTAPLVFGGMNKPNKNPLVGEVEMGAAPDGRELPEYIDFRWREESLPEPPDPTPKDKSSAAHKAWEAKGLADLHALPIKAQRVFIRNRVPAELVRAAIEANRHTPKGQLDEASIKISFIWTDYGIKLRWAIWHRLPSEIQYYSHQGGDEVVPAGKTMVVAYASTIKNDKYVVGLRGYAERYPATTSGAFFPGPFPLACTDRPISGGEGLAGFESESELPEWVHFGWTLLPATNFPREAGESEAAYHFRAVAFFSALPRKDERIPVRSRIPQDVRDEIAAATRNAQSHKVPSSVIYLYFVWTESGIKLHWRLKRSRLDGTFINIREGGDEITQAVGR